MMTMILLSFLPPMVGATIMIPAVLLIIAHGRKGASSRPRRLQLYLAGSAVFRVWSLAALLPLAIVLALGLSGATVLEGVLGFTAYTLLGVSMQLWPIVYFRLAFPLRTRSLNAAVEQPGSLEYARRGFTVLGAYAEFMGLVLALQLAFGFGP
jgi:hypothetical protein